MQENEAKKKSITTKHWIAFPMVHSLLSNARGKDSAREF